MTQFRLTCMLLFLSTAALAGPTVENVRIWAENDKTRVVLDLSQPVTHNIFTLRGPARAAVDSNSSMHVSRNRVIAR